jgi:hypothetical protein
MNTATLFGARAAPSVSAVSGGNAPDPQSAFSLTLGMVKDLEPVSKIPPARVARDFPETRGATRRQ